MQERCRATRKIILTRCALRSLTPRALGLPTGCLAFSSGKLQFIMLSFATYMMMPNIILADGHLF